MKSYVAQRLGIAILTLVGMSIVIFTLLRLAPGDIVDILFSTAGYVNESEKQAILKELGMDRPYWIQYLDWMRQILTGDLGKSYRYDVPAWEVIRRLVPVTIELAVLSIIVAVVLGVPTGVSGAVRQDTALDYVLRVLSLAGLSMPSSWLGMVIILGMVSWLGWIPPLTYVKPTDNFRAHAIQFALPALAVGYRSSALIMRITRSSLPGSRAGWARACGMPRRLGVPVDLVVVGAPARPGWGTRLGRFERRKPLGAAGGAIMLLMVLTAVLAPWLQTHDPIATDAAYTLGQPNAEHWLGTDHLGRDIYSRIVHGAWVSLIVGLGSTLLGSVLGGIIGLLSAYLGGKTDLITQRALDILQG